MNTTNTQKTESILFWVSTIALFYFAFLYLNSELFNFEFVFISVISELITIPMLLVVFGILIFAAIKIIRKSYSNVSYMLAIVVNAVIILTWIVYSTTT